MSNFVVSARKYRPVNFDTVVGQPAVTNTLKNAIKSGHIAHAYLFCGPRGVGKTTCARIFAKTLNCFNLSSDTEACDQCESCKSFDASRSFNIHELDAASNNSVDDIRSLIDKVRILPQVGKYSIYIIDEVHMLSQAAFNAFLKTLEEPPEHAIFILATTEKHKIIPTILSRCQIFDFHRIRVEDIVKYLANVATLENITFEEEALNVIALKADGAMRDSLSIFDQVASFSNRNITYQEVLDNLNVLDYEYYFRITEYFLEGSAANALVLFNEVLQRGFDGQNFMSGLSSHFRDLLVCHDEVTLPLLEVSDALKTRYRRQAATCSNELLYSALEISNQCEMSFKASRNQRLHIELALIRLSNIAVEKKKLNSEPVLLTVPDIKNSPTAPKTPATQQTEPITPVIHPVAAPGTGRMTSQVNEAGKTYEPATRISIKDALNGTGNGKIPENSQPIKASADNRPPGDLSNELQPISVSLLNTCWLSFASQIKDDKPRMAVTLKRVQPEIGENFSISVKLDNRSLLEDFNSSTKADLESYLQKEMANQHITVEALLTESTEPQAVKLYTAEEKFRYLSQMNPALAVFKQKLNLEIE